MKITGIIPARYGSTRFPGKPLALIGSMTMIERVYRQAEKSTRLNSIAVATDDQRIFDVVNSFGGNVVLTSSAHQTGTERCAEALSLLQLKADAVINIQGDEPFLEPSQIDRIAELLLNPEVEIATLVRKATGMEEVLNLNAVKAVMNQIGHSIYFSRMPIPYYKEQISFEMRNYYIHVGIYGYKSPSLNKIVQLKPSGLEAAESLEQLRWIDNGYTIHAAFTEATSHAVDTPEDLERLIKTYRL
ncbi:MAG: 3-deoxy-manno-octulosonate cytidylyltransferase [Bacteroidia bacterium]|nr:3-deoxy-manno-octulosonate cytidylyltransferase [Bacteroidia bacterium]